MSGTRPISASLIAILALVVLGCGGDSLAPRKPVASINVTPTASTIAPGVTVQLQAATKDADGATLTGREITWSSSDNAVATVSEAGLVAGVAKGSATITAASEGKSGAATISVATIALEFVAVTAGWNHTCGLVMSGKAYCWGLNQFWTDPSGNFQSGGQLGDGSTTSSSVPVPVAGGLTFSGLTAGMREHTCGVTTSGAAYCWGWNDFGQLGNPSTNDLGSSVPVAVTGGLTFSAVTAGGTHTCGLSTSGAAYCWGLGSPAGRLGDGLTSESRAPVAVTGGLTFSQVSATGATYPAGHTCGLTTGGAAHCWGGNEWGQLGDGSTTDRLAPVVVTGGLTFTSVSAGLGHTCGLTSNGAAYCWGANGYGQLGDGSNTYTSIPVPLAGGLALAAIASGGLHSCGLTASGAAYCWGSNDFGQLGNATNTPSTTPVPVSGGLSFSAISAGTYHTCGVSSSRAVYCWGGNTHGELGDGSTAYSLVPVRVAGSP